MGQSMSASPTPKVGVGQGGANTPQNRCHTTPPPTGGEGVVGHASPVSGGVGHQTTVLVVNSVQVQIVSIEQVFYGLRTPVAPAWLVVGGPTYGKAISNEPFTYRGSIRQSEPHERPIEGIVFTRVLNDEARCLEQLGHASHRQDSEVVLSVTVRVLPDLRGIEARNVGRPISHRSQINTVTLHGVAIHRRERGTNQYASNAHVYPSSASAKGSHDAGHRCNPTAIIQRRQIHAST